MPEEFGFGMITWPLYSGFSRSFHEVGALMPALAASTVLKQIEATQASMPVQVGGFDLSTNFLSSFSTPFGA